MAAAEGIPSARRGPRRFRRRLRTRIILSFLLLGTGLTALFAFLTDYARQRVESQLVEDVMNTNIDEFARLYALDPSRNPDLPVQQIRAFVYPADRFERARQEFPEWVELPTGIVAQLMGHKPSATAEKHYRVRPLDLLRMWHVKIEEWILGQAGISVPARQGEQQPLKLVATN